MLELITKEYNRRLTIKTKGNCKIEIDKMACVLHMTGQRSDLWSLTNDGWKEGFGK